MKITFFIVKKMIIPYNYIDNSSGGKMTKKVNNKLTIMILLVAIILSTGIGYIMYCSLPNNEYHEELLGEDYAGTANLSCNSNLVYDDGNSITLANCVDCHFATDVLATNADKYDNICAYADSGFKFADGSSYKCISCTVQKKTLNCPTTTKSHPYTGQLIESGINCPDGSNPTNEVTGINAKSYSQHCAPDSNHQFATSCDVSWSITPASVTATANCNNKVYDGTKTAACNVTASGLKEGSIDKSDISCTFDSASAGSRTITCKNIKITGTSNYKLSSSQATTSARIYEAATISCPSPIYVGQTATCTVTANGATLKGSVASANSTYLGVTKSSSSSVTIQGVKATSSGVAVSGTFTVNNIDYSVTSNKVVVKNESITISSDVLNLEANGSTVNVKATVNSYNSASTVNWVTSDSTIVKITNGSKTGATITPGKSGTATVYATLTSNGHTYESKKLTFTVTSSVTVKGVVLGSDSKNISLLVGESKTISYSVNPSVVSQEVTCTSSDKTVATVSTKCVVTAIKKGNATITITSKADTTKSATANITVGEVLEVEGVTLNKSSISLEDGAQYTLVASILPTGAVDKNLNWSSNNEEVATVDNYGQVTATGVGNATITVKTSNNKTATCTVTVTDATGMGETDKSNVNTLKTLGLNVTPLDFSPSKLVYNVTVPYEVESVTYSSTLTDAKSDYVEGFSGNRTVDLRVGLNTFTIKVQAEDNSVKTYVLNISRENEDGYVYLTRDITVDGYNLDFENNIMEYTLNIKGEDKVKFNIITNSDAYEYEISGNDKLVNGSVITVTVHNDDETIEEVYRFNVVSTKSSSDDNQSSNVVHNVPNTDLSVPNIILIAVVCFVIVGASIVYAQSIRARKRFEEKKKNKKDDEKDS